MTLYIKHRPQFFDEIIGNEEVVQSLLSIISRPQESIPHVFLFHGDFGSGKSTLAYLLAKELGCDQDEIIKVDVGTFRKVEDADKIKERLSFLPWRGKIKVYIIDEIQTASGTTSKFQESLLNTLEDGCPSFVYFIFCTTEIKKINTGILSRSVIFSLRNYTVRELRTIQKNVLSKENIPISDWTIRMIASISNGSPREALTNLEKIINIPDLSEENLKKIFYYNNYFEQLKEDDNSIKLIKSLIAGEKWKITRDYLLKNKLKPEELRRKIVAYLHSIIMKNDIISPNIMCMYTLFTETNFIDRYKLTSICLECSSLKDQK